MCEFCYQVGDDIHRKHMRTTPMDEYSYSYFHLNFVV